MLPRRKVMQIAINKYFNLVAHKLNNSYVYGVDSGTSQSFAYYLNLQQELASCQEMIDYIKMADQYKVIGININTDIDRVPQAGDILPKLLLYYDTDKYTTAYPKTASNVMHLSVTNTGNKNYNVLLNRNTIPKDFIGWIDTATAYNTKIQLNIGQANQAYLSQNPDADTRLGTIKVTFNVKFRLRDQQYNVTKNEGKTIQQILMEGGQIEPRYKEMATQTDDGSIEFKEEELQIDNNNSMYLKSESLKRIEERKEREKKVQEEREKAKQEVKKLEKKIKSRKDWIEYVYSTIQQKIGKEEIEKDLQIIRNGDYTAPTYKEWKNVSNNDITYSRIFDHFLRKFFKMQRKKIDEEDEQPFDDFE
jgi:hypothetical protein